MVSHDVVIVEASGLVMGRAHAEGDVREKIESPDKRRLFIHAGETLSGEHLYVENAALLFQQPDAWCSK